MRPAKPFINQIIKGIRPLHPSGQADPISLPSQVSPTPNREHLPIHPLPILAAQESHHARNVLRQPNTTQRGPFGRKLDAHIVSTTLAHTGSESRKAAYLINLLVRHGSIVGDVLPDSLDVHIRFDATGSNGIDCDALAAEVCADL